MLSSCQPCYSLNRPSCRTVTAPRHPAPPRDCPLKAAAKRQRLGEAAQVLEGVRQGEVTEAVLSKRLQEHVERMDSEAVSGSWVAADNSCAVLLFDWVWQAVQAPAGARGAHGQRGGESFS